MRAVLLLSVLGAGCLPQDTRPPPAQITFTASSSELTRTGIASSLTADGFEIHFERVLVNLGRADVGDGEGSGSCNEYSSPGYTRLFDFTQVSAPEELGIAFATGRCPFGYVVRFPNLDAKLGVGASEDDRTFMRTPGNDPVAHDEGIALYLAGSATRGDEFKQFHWAFRQRLRFENCLVPNADGDVGRLPLASSAVTTVNIELHAEALFQGPFGDDLAHFEPFALADADADGEITLEELFGVPIQNLLDAGFPDPRAMPPQTPSPLNGGAGAMDVGPSATGGGAFALDAGPDATRPVPCFDSDGNAIPLSSLGALTYCALVPTIPRMPGAGRCEVSSGFPDRGPD